MAEDKKKKKSAGQIFSTVLSLCIGGVLGVICIWVMGPDKVKDVGFLQFMLVFFGVFAVCILWFLLHVVLHEGGHLVGGLLSGYGFGYFRIGRFTLAKYADGFKLKIFSIPGTGGQCGMIPPAYNNGNFPYKLYLLGGFTVNYITAIITFGVFLLLGADSMVGRMFVVGAVIALYLAIMNSLPLKADLPNDGYQLKQAGRDERERRMLWETLDFQAKSMQGVRISEIERDWNEKSPEELLAQCDGAKGITEFIMYYNYVYDSGRFEEAEELATKLLDKGISVALYRLVFEAEALFFEVYLHGREERIKEMATKELMTFLKNTSATMLSSTRVLYAYEMLYHKDAKEIEKLKKQLVKVLKNYPMLGELKQEQELIKKIEALAENRQAQEA